MLVKRMNEFANHMQNHALKTNCFLVATQERELPDKMA